MSNKLSEGLKKIADIGANIGIGVIFLMVVVGVYPNEISTSYRVFGDSYIITIFWIIVISLSLLAISKVWNTSLFNSQKEIQKVEEKEVI